MVVVYDAECVVVGQEGDGGPPLEFCVGPDGAILDQFGGGNATLVVLMVRHAIAGDLDTHPLG